MFWYKTWKNPILDLDEALHILYASQRSSVIYFLLMTFGHQENVYLNNLGYVHMDRLKISLDFTISKMVSFCEAHTQSLQNTKREKMQQ